MFLWCQEVCTCRVFFKLVRYVCRLCRTDWPLHNQRQEEMSCFKVRNWWQQHGVQALTSEADDIGSKSSLCPVWEQCSWLKPISVLGVLEVKQKRRATPVVTLKQIHTHTALRPLPKYEPSPAYRHVATWSGYAWLKAAYEDDNHSIYYTIVSVMMFFSCEIFKSVGKVCQSVRHH